jgi:hypothetical protein
VTRTSFTSKSAHLDSADADVGEHQWHDRFAASIALVGAVVGPRRSGDKAGGDEDGGADKSGCEHEHQHVSCPLCIATIVWTGPKPKISPISGDGGNAKDRAERRANGPPNNQGSSSGSTQRHARSFARESLGPSSRPSARGLCRTSTIGRDRTTSGM